MKNVIKVEDLLPAQIVGGTGEEGAAVDLRASETFDSVLVMAAVGAITGTPSSVKVKIEECDVNTFDSGVTIAAGGEEFTVTADSLHVKEVVRSKRYIRAVVTIADGAAPTANCHVGAVLNNWSVPYNRV